MVFLRPMSKILTGVIFASKMKNWSWSRVKKNRRYRNLKAVFVYISNIKKKQKCLLTSLCWWAEAGTWREVFLLQKSRQSSLCSWRVQTHSDFCGFVFFFNQSSLVAVLGDSILPTSGPKDNWVTSFLYIRISHSVWEIEDFWNIWEIPGEPKND